MLTITDSGMKAGIRKVLKKKAGFVADPAFQPSIKGF